MTDLTVAEIREMVLDQCKVGAIVIDLDGIIIYATQEYAGRYGKDGEGIVGKRLHDVLPNSMLHRVIATKQPEYCGCFKDHLGNYLMGNRIPLYKDGKMVAVLGTLLFNSLEESQYFTIQIEKLQKKVDLYEKELKSAWSALHTVDDIIAKSPAMLAVKDKLPKIALSDMPVLITGETGVGKEIIAHAIHSSSYRRNGPFVQINCAAIPKELMESELFGYESGAFTGSKKGGKVGRFQIADGGTIFLDEIGEMPFEMQAKLLRALQEGEIIRIGGEHRLHINVRVIAATNRDVEWMVRNNTFREDLYYRLNGIKVELPPLRERHEDIPAFVGMGIRNAKMKHNMFQSADTKHLTAEAMEFLMNYEWPGNVRELLNVVEYSYCMSDGTEIGIENFPETIFQGRDPYRFRTSEKEAERQSEKKRIEQALEKTGGNKKAAADLLGIHRVTLYKKMNKYGIQY